MEKHPIDDLFSRKLSGLTKKPSGEVWKRLQKDKRAEVYWTIVRIRWMVAATVALLLIAGNVLKYSWKSTVSNRIVRVEMPGEIEEKKVPQAITSANLPESANRLPTSDDKAIDLRGNSVGSKSGKVGDSVEQNFMQSISHESEEANEVVTVEVGPMPALAVIQEEPVTESDPMAGELKNTVNENIEVKRETARVVIVHVSVEKEDVSKPTRFKRMLKQLQNAKEGEKVDWEEMGITSKKIFASAGNK